MVIIHKVRKAHGLTETNWNVEASWRNQENVAFPFWYKQGSFDLGVDDSDDEVRASKNKLGYVVVPVHVPAPVKQVE
ncbi:hypothetical protein AgCh_021268 [Apium graveolens]